MNDLRSRRGRAALALAEVAIVGVPSVATASDAHPDRTSAVKQAVKGGQARNVILFIGDGMGDSEITIVGTDQGLRGYSGDSRTTYVADSRIALGPRSGDFPYREESAFAVGRYVHF